MAVSRILDIRFEKIRVGVVTFFIYQSYLKIRDRFAGGCVRRPRNPFDQFVDPHSSNKNKHSRGGIFFYLALLVPCLPPHPMQFIKNPTTFVSALFSG